MGNQAVQRVLVKLVRFPASRERVSLLVTKFLAIDTVAQATYLIALLLSRNQADIKVTEEGLGC